MANQPKKYKKFVATAATATLVASAIVPVASAKSFNDVADNNDHKANIDKISDLGYMGTGDNFNPGANLTRGQVAIILANWAQKEAGKTVPADYTTAQRFEDVELTADDKLLQSAALVFDNEIFTGSNGNLLPANDITRLQMALVLNKAYKAVKGVTLVELAGDTSDVQIGDLDKIPAEHQGVVKALKKLGITAPANFDPNGKVTRGQFATFFIKTIEAEAPQLKVNSVTAVNARELVVEFNSAVDEVTASNPANYGLTVAGTTTAFTVDYDADAPKQVKLILSDANKLTNNNAVQLTVKKNVLQDKTLVGLVEDYTKVWVFNDTVAPKITKVEKSGDDVVVTFDEYVSTIEIIKVNGVTFPAITTGASPSTKTITITNGALNLAAGNYEVLLSGVSDISGNKSSVVTGTFSVTNDTTAPSITKVEQAGDQVIKVTFDKAVTLIGAAGTNFVVKKGGYDLGVTATTTDNKTYTLTLADATPIKVYDTGSDTSAVTLTITGVKSTANNAVANPYTAALTLSKDKTAPTVVSRFNTITDIGTAGAPNEVFDIYFNEEIVLDPSFAVGDITLTDKDGVRQAVTSAYVTNDANGDAKILRVVSTAVQNTGVIKTGSYNINLSAGVVADNAGNDIAATNVAIAKTAAAATVTATASAATNVITINYNATMTTAATNVANYLLDGKALPAGTNIYFSGNTQTVVIELPAGTVKSTGGAVLTISDSVVSTGGAKLTAASKTQNIATGFVDNVKPKLASAKKLTDSTIELTFDENISDASFSAAGSADNDFVVKVNGVDFTYNLTTGSVANDNKVVLTTTTAFNIGQNVTVSVTSTAGDVTIADAAGNKLTVGTTVTAN